MELFEESTAFEADCVELKEIETMALYKSKITDKFPNDNIDRLGLDNRNCPCAPR